MKKDNKLKIGLISYRSNPFSGGQGIYIRHLSSSLYELGHEVEVISGPPYPELRKEVILIKIASLDLFSAINRFKEFKLGFLASYTDLFEWFSVITGGFPEPYTFGRRLEKFLKDKKGYYNILHDNQSLTTSLLRIQKDFPLLTTIHHPITRDYELELDRYNNFKDRLLVKRWHSFLGMQKKVAKKLNNILCVSRQSAADVSEDFNVNPENISVVLNGVDMNIFKPNHAIVKTDFRIVTAASADIPLKGLEFLIQALPKIKTSYPDVTLEVIGKAQEGGLVDQLMYELELKDVVNFNHGISEQKISELYCSADIAVIPSLYEGFGFGAAEAMACALPVISTQSGGLAEVIGDAAYLVKPSSSEEISEAVISLFKNPVKKKALSEKGLDRMQKNFSWVNAAELTVTAYLKAINRFKEGAL